MTAPIFTHEKTLGCPLASSPFDRLHSRDTDTCVCFIVFPHPKTGSPTTLVAGHRLL